MSNIKELTHTLEIVYNKLEQCNTQQREIINKVNLLALCLTVLLTHSQMSTKRTLLHESHQVLQKQYCSSLTQDLPDRNQGPTITTEPQQHMVSILGDTRPNTTVIEPHINFNLIKCQAWLRGKRVWIQAQGIVL